MPEMDASRYSIQDDPAGCHAELLAIIEQSFDPQFGESWNSSQLASQLLLPGSHWAVVSDITPPNAEQAAPGRQAAGFILSREAAGEEELLLIAVLPNYRRNGLGNLLLNHWQKSAKLRGVTRLFLEMRENNPALALYSAAGFEQIGRRKGYYRKPGGGTIDAITFAASI